METGNQGTGGGNAGTDDLTFDNVFLNGNSQGNNNDPNEGQKPKGDGNDGGEGNEGGGGKPDLTDAHKALGGVSFDETGNLLDKDNKVVKTKAELESDTGSGEEGDVDLFISPEGAVVTKDGKVVIKKEDVKRDENGQIILPDDLNMPDEPQIKEIIKAVGIIPKNEKGEEKEYTDDIAGVRDYVKDSFEVYSQNKFKSFFESNQEVKRYYQHLALGGKPEEYFTPNKGWMNIDVEKADVGIQKEIVADLLNRQGMDKAEAVEIAKIYETSGSLAEKAKAAKEAHLKLDKAEELENETALKQQEQERTQKIVEHWSKVESVIKSGKLTPKGSFPNSTIGDVNIPEADRDAFYKYIAIAADESGQSQAALDRRKEDLQTRILFDYLRFKRLNLADIIKAEAAMEKVATLRLRKANIGSSAGKIRKLGKGAKDDEITIDSIT